MRLDRGRFGENTGESAFHNRPSDLIRLANAAAHWISGFVLIYALLRNGETSGAMTNDVAMRGEVRLGLCVAFIFLLRFVWVKSTKAARGRWTTGTASSPASRIIRLTNWAVYLAVAVIVISGLLIAYLRPGAIVIPHERGLTNKLSLNLAINTHVFSATVLEWLCAFHVATFVWLWFVRRTRLGLAAESWLTRASTLDKTGILPFVRGLLYS